MDILLSLNQDKLVKQNLPRAPSFKAQRMPLRVEDLHSGKRHQKSRAHKNNPLHLRHKYLSTGPLHEAISRDLLLAKPFCTGFGVEGMDRRTERK